MVHCLWTHYIDNEAAQASLVSGSSGVASGDLIIGCTWELVARRRLWPWFDRVDTKANPIGGVSRGDLSGPWDEVIPAVLPKPLLARLRKELY